MSGRRDTPIALGALLAELPGADVRGERQLQLTDIAFDSREARPGGAFVALRGGYVDGHDYLRQARAAGAAVAVVEHDCADAALDDFAAVVRVPDTRAALAPLADAFFEHPSRALRVVGVTGTDGKTTTSHLIEALCRAAGLCTGLIGTVEVRIGEHVDRHASRQTTPESLLTQGYLAAMRDAGAQVAVLEATSHGLAMHRLDGVLFDVGVVTNVTHEHLDFHGSLENYRAAKGSLFTRVGAARAAGKLGAAIINRDDAGARAIESFAAKCAVTTYALDTPADVTAGDIRNLPTGTAFELTTPQGVAPVALRLRGRYNVANALAAAAAGLALGLELETVAAGLGALDAVPGRLEPVDEGQPFTVLVDYAHTPDALRTILREARGLAGAGRVLTLFGSAGERDVAKRALQGAVAMELADFAIFSSEDPRFEDPDAIIAAIARGATEAGGRSGVHFDCIEDRQAAITALLARAKPGDVVVLAGKGHEHSMIYGAERRPWDDAEAARRSLRQLGYGHASAGPTA
jgi:UDP-N-acetylmuramoyl-L-alanyl-D-glutamate--2,6-diaminopimelate ligase